MSAADYRTLYDMRVSIAHLQATVQAAVRTAEQLKEQMTDVKAVIKSNPAPDSVSKQAEAVDKELTDIVKKLRGDPETDASADDRKTEEPSIQERVNNVATEIGDVTSQPTDLQRSTLALATSDLQREVGRINALLQRGIPALNASLDAARIPWTIGRPVELTK
jgi:Ulp1 family protease